MAGRAGTAVTLRSEDRDPAPGRGPTNAWFSAAGSGGYNCRAARPPLPSRLPAAGPPGSGFPGPRAAGSGSVGAGAAFAGGQRTALASRPSPPCGRSSGHLGVPLVPKAVGMVSWMICRLVVLVFGMLYPAYASYKAVKTKNIREYVRWMMYWIIFAIFMAAETFTDVFISWFPFYYEIKMAFVLWLLSPYTKGASLLYRKFVHPSLSRHEKEIDAYIVQAKERSYETVLTFGKRSLNIAASAAVQAATKSQGALAGRLRSFSMQDLRSIPDTSASTYQDPLYLEDEVPRRRPPIGYRAGGLQDSDTEDGCWSDTEAAPQPPTRPREKPLSRSQSLRVVRRKPPVREGTSRSLKVRTRKKTTPSDMDS